MFDLRARRHAGKNRDAPKMPALTFWFEYVRAISVDIGIRQCLRSSEPCYNSNSSADICDGARRYGLLCCTGGILPASPPEERGQIFFPEEWANGKNPTARKSVDINKDFDRIIENIVVKKPEVQNRFICVFWNVRLAIASAADAANRAVRAEAARRAQHARLKYIEGEMLETAAEARRLSDRWLDAWCSESARAAGELGDRLYRTFFDYDNEDRINAADFQHKWEFGIRRGDSADRALTLSEAWAALKELRISAEALQYKENDNLLRCCKALLTLARMAHTERKRISLPPNTEIWKAVFIQSIGIYWHILFQKSPPSSGGNAFAEFVRSAYAALGGNNTFSDHLFREAVAKVRLAPEWDRFDRYQNNRRRAYEKREADADEINRAHPLVF